MESGFVRAILAQCVDSKWLAITPEASMEKLVVIPMNTVFSNFLVISS